MPASRSSTSPTSPGFPEMMDGRVKTLHPKVHGGILARRQRPDDLAALAAHGITPDRPRRREPVSVRAGGGAGGHRRRRPHRGNRHRRAEPGARGRQELPRRARRRRARRTTRRCSTPLDAPDGPPLSFRFDLARRAIAHTAAYDHDDRDTLGEIQVDDRRGAMSRAAAAARCRRCGRRSSSRSAICATARTRTRPARGTDADRRGRIRRRRRPSGQGAVVHEPARSRRRGADRARVRRAGGGRHQAHQPVRRRDSRNAGRAPTSRARDADPLSAFGGIVGLNRPIDLETARALTSTFIEAVIAPSLPDGPADDEVRAVLATKPNLRVVTADFSTDWPAIATCGRFSAPGSCRRRTASSEAGAPWPGATAPPSRRHAARADGG